MARAASKFSRSAPAVEREFNVTRLPKGHPLKTAVFILLTALTLAMSADAARGACRTATLIVPPIR
jgi:hypothetical protein